jgi:hypothetical protein
LPTDGASSVVQADDSTALIGHQYSVFGFDAACAETAAAAIEPEIVATMMRI